MRGSLLQCSYVSFVPQKVIPDPRLLPPDLPLGTGRGASGRHLPEKDQTGNASLDQFVGPDE
jgi:hypothetical protein